MKVQSENWKEKCIQKFERKVKFENEYGIKSHSKMEIKVPFKSRNSGMAKMKKKNRL